MSEIEWLKCESPDEMVAFLQTATEPFKTRWLGWMTRRRFSVSDRKWDLLGCACLRRVLTLLPGDSAALLLSLLERRASGNLIDNEILRVIDLFQARPAATCAPAMGHAVLALDRFRPNGGNPSWPAFFDEAALAQTWHQESDWDANASRQQLKRAEHARQADLVRCIIGNPFAPSRLNPEWLVVNDQAVERIVQAIDEEATWGDLPVLADALEEAGCDDANILGHCRSMGPHARGCWVVELLLEVE